MSGKKKTEREIRKDQEDMKKIEEDGKDIYDSLKISRYPVMIPPAPCLSKFIDKYDEGSDLSESNRESKTRQEDYEAEVKVYRALERLDEKIIVVHGLEYTHGEYTLFVGEHSSKDKDGEVQVCRKKNKEPEEECDLLVIGQDYFVIIEVKNPSRFLQEGDDYRKKNSIEELNKKFERSVDQRLKTAGLINAINKDAVVLQFTAYPNLGKEYKAYFNSTLAQSQLSSIIFKEDIENFQQWWMENVIFSSHKLARVFSSVNWHELRDLSGAEDYSNLVALVLQQCSDITVSLLNGIIHNYRTSYPSWQITITRSFRKSKFKNKTYLSTELFSELYTMSIPWSRYNKGEAGLLNSGDAVMLRVTHILLALWCRTKNKCDKLKCSLRKTIRDVDEKLRDGEFTFISGNRDRNPAIVPESSDIFIKYLGLKNITKRQLDAFQSDHDFFSITGPAGSGKTVVMCMKVIQLALNDRNKKFFVFQSEGPRYRNGDGNVVVINNMYEEALKKAGITYHIITNLDDIIEADMRIIKQRIMQDYQVVIIKMQPEWGPTAALEKYKEGFMSLKDSRIFIDDVESINPIRDNGRAFEEILKEWSRNNFVWMAFDVAQTSRYQLTVPLVPGPEGFACDRFGKYEQNTADTVMRAALSRMVTLEDNLRNTYDIGRILSAIRERYSESTRGPAIKRVIPEQKIGHFIHGPLVEIHIFKDLEDWEGDLFKEVLTEELCVLLNQNDPTSRIGIVHSTLEQSKIPSVLEEIKSTLRNNDSLECDKIDICHSEHVFGPEWPAVLALHEVYEEKSPSSLTELYRMISRARVKCSVFMYFYETRDILEEGYETVFRMLALEGSAKVFLHSTLKEVGGTPYTKHIQRLVNIMGPDILMLTDTD